MPNEPDSRSDHGLTYRDAGVDIDTGNALVERIKPAVRRTHRPEVLSPLGGFGGLFELPLDRYTNPVLVSGTDGVGTKLKLANRLQKHDTIGIDLVAMCVNDILVQGAEPLFFLDYFATGKLSIDNAASVIEGIAEGCRLSGMALIGGETAEMPGMYAAGEYDLAGFSVGIADKNKLLNPDNVKPGDQLIGIASSGVHSNGFSLVNRILEINQTSLETPIAGSTLGEALIKPTTIYVQTLLPLIQAEKLNALAHITGGGLTENLPRILPENTCARIDVSSWPRPELFRWLQQQGNIDETEMRRVFNCGIGMVAVTNSANAEAVIDSCRQQHLQAWNIGEVVRGKGPGHLLYTE